VIPVAVAILFKVKIPGYDLSFLPPFYAGINGLTAVLLIGALIAIKNKNVNLHQTLIQASLFLSVLFLLCYVAYHITSDSTAYKGDLPGVYFPLLISHIVLSVAVIPIVLFTYLFAWQGDFVKHKKWTKFAFPIWLYVAVTGVIVYFMIAPFYQH
jgi:putative membrane protein